MKNLIITSVVCYLCFLSTNLNSTNFITLKYDSLSCLVIEGKISNLDDNTDSECTVELMCLNKVIDSIVLKEGKKKFKFVLNKNLYYTIKISKKGYVSKLVSIDTEILTEVSGVYQFAFETTLIEESISRKLNQDVLDFPVSIIQFDYKMGYFSYNKEYTIHIKKKLYHAEASAH